MRRLKRIVRTRHSSGAHGHKFATSIRGSGESPEAIERRIEGFFLVVVRMAISPHCIRLPDFEHSIRNRSARTIKHAANQRNALAFRFGSCKRTQSSRSKEAQVKEGPHGLR